MDFQEGQPSEIQASEGGGYISIGPKGNPNPKQPQAIQIMCFLSRSSKDTKNKIGNSNHPSPGDAFNLSLSSEDLKKYGVIFFKGDNWF